MEDLKDLTQQLKIMSTVGLHGYKWGFRPCWTLHHMGLADVVDNIFLVRGSQHRPTLKLAQRAWIEKVLAFLIRL